MAETSAVASMAAHKQGKFFEYVDKLYSDTKKQDKETLEGYAKELGLDVAGFQKDLEDPELLRYVRMDAAAGGKIGVGGTPSVYLNGAKMNLGDVEAAKKAVKAEIAAVDALVAAGKTVEAARLERIEEATNTAKVYLEQVAERDTGAISVPAHGPATAAVVLVKYTDFQ